MLTRTIVAASALALALVPAAGCESVRIGNPSVNVLKRVDPARDEVHGVWRFEGTRLQSEATQHARLALPVVPYGDYELSMQLSRIVGEGSANVILPVGDTQVMLVLGGGPGGGWPSGLEYVDGSLNRDDITTDRRFELINHRVYRIDVTVRTEGEIARVDVDVDRRPFIRWLGPPAALSLPPEWSLGGTSTLGLGSYDAVVEYRTARLRTIPGETSWLN